MSKTARELIAEFSEEILEDMECQYKLEPKSIKPSGVEYHETVMAMFDEAVEKAKQSKPTQYQIGIDTFDRMKANCTLEEIIGGCKLNIDKYVWRKKGCDKEDLKKAKDYIDLWIWALDNK